MSVNGANSVLTLNTTGTATQSAAITATQSCIAWNRRKLHAQQRGQPDRDARGQHRLGQPDQCDQAADRWRPCRRRHRLDHHRQFDAHRRPEGSSDITVSNPVSCEQQRADPRRRQKCRDQCRHDRWHGRRFDGHREWQSHDRRVRARSTGRTVALAATGAFINNRGSDAVSCFRSLAGLFELAGRAR